MAHLSDGTTQDVTAGTTFTLSNTSLATMANKTVTAKAAGSLTVQAAYIETAPAGSSPASATVAPQNLTSSTTIAITPTGGSGSINVPTITWNAPAAISYGTALGDSQLNATANVAGTFVYTPAAGTVLPMGNQTLSVLFTPNDTKTYSAATATVQLSVGQTKPVITWQTPGSISVGTALSATQLDATASVPGTFVYNPAAGTVPAAGTQTLQVAFTPTDTTNYSSATASVQLQVGSPTQSPSNPTPPTNPPTTPVGCGGPTVNIDPSMSSSAIQDAINKAPVCSLISFGAGTYNITSTINLQCGVTYSGPATGLTNGMATPTAILKGSSMGVGAHIFALWSSTAGNPCSQKTTIEFLNFNGNSGISVETPFTNLLIQYNTFTNIPGSKDQTDAAEFNSANGANNTNAVLTNTTITHNIIGDTNSCLSPVNVMADVNSPEDYNGACNGMVFQASIDGLTITNNNLVHVSEGVHVNCPNLANQQYVCEPPGGATTKNMTIEYNDFSNIHRIAWEEQPQQSSGVVYQYNSEHDWVNPYFGSMGTSFACCYNGTGAPYLNVSHNVIIFNTSPGGNLRYGYGTEGNGHNATYSHNYLAAANYPVNNVWTPGAGIVYGCGPVANVSDNTVVGGFDLAFIVSEGLSGCGTDGIPATMSGNDMGATLKTLTSAAPSISPSAASYSYPLTVTLNDSGNTSSGPSGNTGIWYTTDGSTPVPGQGTAQYLADGGTFVLNGPATVKAVGMWGAVNQPASYPSGFGFTPSNVVSASFTGAGSAKQPAQKAHAANTNAPVSPVAPQAPAGSTATGSTGAVLESVAISPVEPAVSIGSTTQLKAMAIYDDGSVKDITANFAWQSSDARILTANAAGGVAGIASGTATVSGTYQGFQASAKVVSSIGEVDWSDPIVITSGGTYTGNWESKDGKTPAVMVATTEPVTIENSHLRSNSDLIATAVKGANLTVRNSLGIAVNTTVKGQKNGDFLEVFSPASLDVENNYVENASGGVIVHGYSGSRDGLRTIVIRGNRARNVNGMVSDGKGGHLSSNGANASGAHFIQFDSVQAVPRIDVGWNEVVNYSGQSLVDDNIDLYRSSGTANQPLEIHDTYIQGAYPVKPTDAYAGGGIETKGGARDTAEQASAFNNIHDNQVVATTNHGIKFAAGHDNLATNNRLISSGLTAEGSKIAAQDAGLANGSGVAQSGSMYNNSMRDNLVGWTCWQSNCAEQGYRKDQYLPAAPADYNANAVVTARRISLEMENNEYQVWVGKMTAAGIAVGPSFN